MITGTISFRTYLHDIIYMKGYLTTQIEKYCIYTFNINKSVSSTREI